MALTYKQKFNKKYGFAKDKAHSLRDIARITGRPYKGIKQIFEKGEGAFYSNPASVRPNMTPQRWAYARVYSAVMGGKASKVDAKELGDKKKMRGFIGRKKVGGKYYYLLDIKKKKTDIEKSKKKFQGGFKFLGRKMNYFRTVKRKNGYILYGRTNK